MIAVNVSRLSTVVLAARGVPVGEFLGSSSKSDATKENVGRLARCLFFFVLFMPCCTVVFCPHVNPNPKHTGILLMSIIRCRCEV